MLSLTHFTFNAFSENTYLIYNEKKDCWIVDPGMYDAEETQGFIDFIEKNGLKPVSIINTHTHIDHIFGVQALKDHFRIPFLYHEKDKPVLDGARGAAMMFGFTMETKPEADGFIEQGKVLMLGDDTIEVRLAPGHSPGSIVFYYAAGNWAIAGDVLFAGSIGRADLPGGDYDTLIHSVQTQLFTLPEETVVWPGHGPETTIGVEKRTNPFFR